MERLFTLDSRIRLPKRPVGKLAGLLIFKLRSSQNISYHGDAIRTYNREVLPSLKTGPRKVRPFAREIAPARINDPYEPFD